MMSFNIALLALIAMFTAGLALAGDGYPNGKGFEAIEADLDEVKDQLDGVEDQLIDLQEAIGATSNTLIVQASVDTTYCASKPVHCSGTNFQEALGWINGSLEPGANGNPIAMDIHVTSNGQPVTGLGVESFDFFNRRAPAGSVSVNICEGVPDGRCRTPFFGSTSRGYYRILLDPVVDDASYKTGSYAAILTVTFEDESIFQGSTLVNFRIPPRP